MNSSDRRLIAVFKLFVDKAIVPHLQTNERALAEWSRFSILLNQANYGHLQQFVEAIPSPPSQIELKKEEIRINVLLAPSSFSGVDRNKLMLSEVETRRELITGKQLISKLKEDNMKGRALSVSTDPIQYGGQSRYGQVGNKAVPFEAISGLRSATSAVKIQDVSRNLQRLLNTMQQNQIKIEGLS